MSTFNNTIAELSDYLERRANAQQDLEPFSQESLLALYTMAYELYRNGKYQDAKAFFQFLTIADSFERKYWMGLGACCQMLKTFHEAIDCYSAAALQDPSDPYAHWHAADCFFQLHDLPKAQAALHSAIMAAKENEAHQAILPQLVLLEKTWSTLSKGINHG